MASLSLTSLLSQARRLIQDSQDPITENLITRLRITQTLNELEQADKWIQELQKAYLSQSNPENTEALNNAIEKLKIRVSEGIIPDLDEKVPEITPTNDKINAIYEIYGTLSDQLVFTKKIKIEEAKKSEKDLEADKVINEAIKKSRSDRAEKTRLLSDFQKDIKSLEDELSKLLDELKKEDKDSYEFIENISNKIFTLIENFKKFKLTKDDFGVLYNPETSDLELSFFKEVMLNKCANYLYYQNEFQGSLIKNKEQIKSIFFPADHRDKEVTLLVTQLKGETHHRGKHPVTFHFKFNNEVICKVMYKPRSAEVDKRVIKLFKDINELDEAKRSAKHLLPVYEILTFEKESFWEFIEGKQLSSTERAGQFIASLNGPNKESLTAKLNRMDAVLTVIHMGDLHGENIIYRGLDGNNPEIVPIDLENVVESNTHTGLRGMPNSVNLTQDEQRLIIDFNKEAKEYPCRVVVVATHSLGTLLSSYDNYIKLAEVIYQGCAKDYTLTNEPTIKQELQMHVLLDMLNQDVPYFTEYKGNLYYGLPGDYSLKIGEKKQKRES